MAPSLVTWPTRKAAMPRPLARSMSRAAHSRTWLTLPGDDSSPGRKTVWIESTMSGRGRSARRGAAPRSARRSSPCGRSPGRCRASAPRSRRSDSDRPIGSWASGFWRHHLFLGPVARLDRGAYEGAQEKAALRALEKRDHALVQRRVDHELPQSALAGIELLAHRAEIGEG